MAQEIRYGDRSCESDARYNTEDGKEPEQRHCDDKNATAPCCQEVGDRCKALHSSYTFKFEVVLIPDALTHVFLRGVIRNRRKRETLCK